MCTACVLRVCCVCAACVLRVCCVGAAWVLRGCCVGAVDAVGEKEERKYSHTPEALDDTVEW